MTYAVNAMRGERGEVVWRRNYNEHVIRDEKGIQAKHCYFLGNPLNWEKDSENIE